MKQSEATGPSDADRYRFDPPPGWPPPPPGWLPPAGWAPDPAWPPAPPGWQFVVRAHRPDPMTLDGGADVTGLLATAAATAAKLEQALGARAASLAKLESRLGDIAKPRKLRSIGTLKRVVLYDAHVTLPGTTVPLSSEVRASAENQGNKQVVQGWVSRSTNDRREMFLHVDWPGGYQLVHWERNDKAWTGAQVTPSDVHTMAAAINQAAATAEVMRRHRTQQSAAARAEHSSEWAEVRVQIHHALIAAEEQMNLLTAVAGERRQRVATADASQRKRLGRELQQVEKQLAVLARSTSDARAVLSEHESQPEPEPEEPTGAGASTPRDLIALLEDLGRLRDAGVLTPAEFDARKAEILSRL